MGMFIGHFLGGGEYSSAVFLNFGNFQISGEIWQLESHLLKVDKVDKHCSNVFTPSLAEKQREQLATVSVSGLVCRSIGEVMGVPSGLGTAAAAAFPLPHQYQGFSFKQIKKEWAPLTPCG